MSLFKFGYKIAFQPSHYLSDPFEMTMWAVISSEVEKGALASISNMLFIGINFKQYSNKIKKLVEGN